MPAVLPGLCLGLSLLLLLGGCHGKDNPSSSSAKVVRRDFASTVLATGTVEPQVGAEVRVGARMSGKVTHLTVNIGDVVKKGQALAQLEKADLQAAVDERIAELQLAEAKLFAVKILRPKEIEKAEADVKRWQAVLVPAKKELERHDLLHKTDITSQQDWDLAEERVSVAEAQLASMLVSLELARKHYIADMKIAEAEVKRTEAALAQAEAKCSYATITAPINGVIASVSTLEGETVAAGLNAPTFVTIIDLERLQVDAFVDEVDIGKIKVGQKAEFSVDAFPGHVFEGKVAAIYPKAVVQENVVNYDVVVGITTPCEGLLRPEMTASVTIFLEARTNVLAAPLKAVRRQRGKNVVSILLGDTPEQREVVVGWKDGQWVEIIKGLEEGQTVLFEAE